MRVVATSALMAFLVTLSAACGGGSGPEAGPAGATPAAGGGASPRADVSMDKNDYPVFPDADSGADPSVPAEEGGAGFTGEGWETNSDFDLIGDPRAIKGGSIRYDTLDFPGTLRVYGPDTTVFNQLVHDLVFERLLGTHPTTEEFIPGLATHWQVSDDLSLYRFRLNPNARFSDGTPVTAEDVVASWDLIMDPNTQAANYSVTFERYERPVAESKYIVSVRAKDPSWRNLGDLTMFWIMPAEVIRTFGEGTYLRDYNFKLMPGSGPYTISEQDIDRGNRITIRRRDDHWAEGYRATVGLFNFDEITGIVVRDRNLAFEMAKRGDLDFYLVTRAQMWVQELEFEQIQMGWMQKRKIFTQEPQSIAMLAFNTREAPFDDVRVRQAMTLLQNRQQLIEKLYFNEYLPQNSLFAGGVYENLDNPTNEYNPQRAIELLREAGYTERNDQGVLIRNGQPLSIEVIYGQQQSEPALTIFQEDLRRVGISLNLRFLTFATMVKLLDERQFQMLSIAFSASKPYPMPRSMFHSSQADQQASNNLSGFKNERADEIIEAYDVEGDLDTRIELIRELDGIVANSHIYMLEWYAPYNRLVYWNKYGQPESYLSRIGLGAVAYYDPFIMWWHDPAKEAALNQARQDNAALEVGPSEIDYWSDFADPAAQSPAP
jgi:microcin C transport system substrate-binding protein